MPVEVIMPKVDMDMATGTVSVWHVEEGTPVAKGDPLFDIETDKAAMEVEAQEEGTVHHRVAAGTELAIGQPVAWIYAAGEEVGDAPSPASATPATGTRDAASTGPAVETDTGPTPPAQDQIPDAPPAPSGMVRATPRATPRARARAREEGIDLATVEGTGPRNRIQADDIPRQGMQARPAPLSFTPEYGPLSVTRAKGGTGVPVVLIHGFASDAKSWAALEPYLSDHPVIRIDLPCHGKSPNLRIGQFSGLVKTVRQAFDSLNLDAAHIIGHSLGGAAALALADTRPRTIASLSLIAPGGLGPDIGGAVLGGITGATRVESLAPWLRHLVHDETLITDGYARAVMATRANPALAAAQTALAETLFPDGTQAFDLRAALHRVRMPTRVIWGRQDRIIPWQHALTAPGNVALHLFEATGHMPHIERSDEVGKLLQSAL